MDNFVYCALSWMIFWLSKEENIHNILFISPQETNHRQKLSLLEMLHWWIKNWVIKTIKNKNPVSLRLDQKQHCGADQWFIVQQSVCCCYFSTAFLQCPHPVHTIVSISDQLKLVRSGQHCKGFPLALNDFLGIHKGNNGLRFGYLPGTQ